MHHNKSKFLFYFTCLLSIAMVNGCIDNSGDKENEGAVIQKESVTGIVQKGPFNRGSMITLFELNKRDFSQTGRSFTSQVDDDQGHFQFNNIELTSAYADFAANGFYFNEVLGKQSASQINLQAIANVTQDSSFNINVLSHLEKPRVEYLVSNGREFEESKKQAQSEIISIFQIEDEHISPSQKMNLISENKDSAILLTISSILQGYRSEADLSELLSLMAEDLKEDGELNDAALGSKLINHAIYLTPDIIRDNLKQRYADLGFQIEIPDFEQYLTDFIDQTSFEITERLIDYPAEGTHGENILDPERLNYKSSTNTSYFISLAADLAEGTSLKIRISTLEGTPTAIDAMWAYDTMSPVNWEVKQYNLGEHSQEFVALESGKSSDMKIRFYPGKFLVEYFEMETEAEEPRWSREFTVTE